MTLNRAIVVDDHPLVRMAVRVLLSENGFSVLAESDNGLEAQKLVELHQPDILVIDVDIPTVDGIEVVKALRRRDYAGIIIMISGKNADVYARLCADAGANGFVSKKNNLPEILSAINAGMNGYSYFPMKKPRAATDDKAEEKNKIETLSTQEFRVFQQLVEGLHNSDIAKNLHLSGKTVSTYKTRLMEKLGCSTTKELYEFAKRNNID